MKPTLTIMSRLFWPRRFGGLEHVLWQLSNAFVDCGAELTVLAEHAEGTPDLQDARPDLHIQRFAPVDVGRLWRVGELVQVRWWMKALRNAPSTGWLWANEPTAAVAAIRAGRAKDLIYRPVFCYDALNHVSQTYPEMRGLRRSRLARWLDRYAYRHAAHIIDESDNLRGQHIRHYGDRDRLHVVRNGVAPAGESSTSNERFGMNGDEFIIGFVGRPGDPCKDLPFLLRALEQNTFPDHARLLIVGGGDGLDDARQWVRQAGWESRTVWTGALADPAPGYRAMDVMVLPSRFETFGNVILEAQSHGVPTIARRRDANAVAPIYTASEELIEQGKTGFTVDPHDPADLAHALHSLIANPDHARNMGARAATRMSQNTWHDTARAYLEILGYHIRKCTPPIRQAA
ncbi:MAG: glycosyltransferase family 4 protein [Phycisphaerales bacterium JB063]